MQCGGWQIRGCKAFRLLDCIAIALGHRLGESGIIVTAIRLPEQLRGEELRIGAAEITRRGATEPLMDGIARVVAAPLLSRRFLEQSRERAHTIADHLRGYASRWESATGAQR